MSVPSGITFDLIPAPSIRISEIHWDNTGTDANERIEISGPAGASIEGYKILLYNGNGGATYEPTRTLHGTLPATCGGRGVVFESYPVNGIQNGDPDGVALIDQNGALIEFFSYGGTMIGVGGAANGVTSTVFANAAGVPVRETSTTPVGFSLPRLPDGSWGLPAANTFGACNDDDGTVTPPAVVASVVVSPASATVVKGATQTFTATAFDASNQPIPNVAFAWTSNATGVATVGPTGIATAIDAGDAEITATASNNVAGHASLHVTPVVVTPMPDTRFSELHYDNGGTDVGERIEVEGPAAASLNGWSIVLYDGNGGGSYFTQPLTGTLVAGTGTCSTRGVLTFDFAQIQNGSPDGMALVDGEGHVVEFLSYEGTLTATNGPAAGLTSADIVAIENGSGPIAGSLRRSTSNSWSVASANDFGSVNACGGPVTEPPPSKAIIFSGRDPVGDAPLPVGFESQLFANESVNGVDTPTTITWKALTPSIATIDDKGVFHGVSAGTASFMATAADGTSGTRDMPIITGVHSAINYTGNTLFGEPRDADASDDYLVRRPEYTTSYNVTRGTPNWVSYRVVDDYHPSGIDRCNCFTFDPELPSSFPRYTTGDYTGAGAFAGYGIDRGHLARSFDRTGESLDNAATYYFSNIIPQAADLNQGPWKILEDSLGNLAYQGDHRSIYVIAGAYGNKATVKGEGRIIIPTAVWKVAVILPHDRTLADIHSVNDLQVIAVIMPNDPGVRNIPWSTYKTTVDEVERQSGYDILAALPDNIERAVESGDSPPVAVASGPTTGNEGSALTFDGSSSSDADAGDVLSYSWTFSDGGSATGVNASHTFADNGSYTVTLTVTDAHGVTDETTKPVSIANVAPTVGGFGGATILRGERYAAAGSFTDPGADTWTGSVNYGDGSGSQPLALSGSSFSLSHSYAAAGTFTVTVTVRDDDTGESSRTATVVIMAADAAIGALSNQVTSLVSAGVLGNGEASALDASLRNALKSLDKDNPTPARNELEAFISKAEAMRQSGRLDAATAGALTDYARRILASFV